MVSAPEHANLEEGLAFTLFGVSTPVYDDPSAQAGGLLCVCYIKNLDEKALTITQMGIWTNVAQYIEAHVRPTGTPINTETLTPTNMNLSSGNVASGDFYSGSSINGISVGTRISRFRIPANGATNFNSLDSKIVIPKNNIFAIFASSEGTPIEFTFNFYYHEE